MAEDIELHNKHKITVLDIYRKELETNLVLKEWGAFE